ncbi:MAG: DUF4260 domain-containing protein [Rickettsiales bacterium]|jgi:hypothetical protein|nr:DUF4260 domain-containing protein [Rickettsiales bacterium]
MLYSNKHNEVSGYVAWILRAEALVVLIAMIIYYQNALETPWKTFFILFFIPDISLLGYFINKKVGTFSYNLMHSYISPLVIGTIFWYYSLDELNYLIVIWIAHIGFYRTLGFGLKYFDGFRFTHLKNIGRY